MKAPVVLVLGCVLGGGCVHDSLLALTPGVDEFPGTEAAEVPHDGPLAREIAAGYARYGVLLAVSGQWSADPAYGVRWCPQVKRPLPFVPYVSSGHWAPVELVTAPHAPLPDGTPYWIDDGREAWTQVTMHHGWWVNEEVARNARQWCWVPGVAETPARVFWREGDGFVAWAAEPPQEEPGDDDDLLDWVFEFTGTLFDDDLQDELLQGDAADAADVATRQGRARERSAGHPPARVGPSRATVSAARTALSEYTVAHPSVAPPAAAISSHETASGERPLPRASVLYTQLARDPVYLGGTRAHASSLPVIPSRGASHGGGDSTERTPGLNSYAGRAGAGSGGDCGSHSGGHTASASSPRGNSYAGKAGSSSGGDCGSHDAHHK